MAVSNRPPVLTWLNHSEFLVTEFLESDLSPERSLPIYFNHHYKTPLPEGKLIYYNIEHLSRQSELTILETLWKSGKIEEVWDYSVVNCALLTAKGIRNRYVPFSLTPARMNYYTTLTQSPKLYDVGFCGALSPRRELVLKGLRDAGLQVLALHTVWGEQRDIQLATCKIILNVHYGAEYMVFEKTRCDQWLSVGVPVISENSLDNDKRAICVAYDKLVETCVNYVRGIRVLFCGCGECNGQP